MLKAIAIFLLCAIALVGAIYIAGESSCNHPPKTQGEETETKEDNQYDCSTTYATFKLGLFESWKFVRNSHDEIIAVATTFIAIFTIILGSFTISLAKSTRIAADAAKDSAKVAKDSLVIANRPRIVPRPKLCESNDTTTAPQIRFTLRNMGKVAVVDRVDVTAQTIRSGVGLAKTFPHVPVTINSEIDAGQKLGGYHITLDHLGVGVPDPMQRVKSGEIDLKIIFEIVSKDMFGNDYKPTISFDFNHERGVFTPSNLLKPENKQ